LRASVRKTTNGKGPRNWGGRGPALGKTMIQNKGLRKTEIRTKEKARRSSRNKGGFTLGRGRTLDLYQKEEKKECHRAERRERSKPESSQRTKTASHVVTNFLTEWRRKI